MKRKFLEELGLTKEQIDNVMAENGKDIEAEKEKAATTTAELEDVKNQLKEANSTITDLKKNNVDNKALQTKVKEYEDTIKNQKTDYEAKVRNLTLDSAIEKALNNANAKHGDLLSSKIDREKLVIGNDGKVTGLDEQIKGLKDNYKDLFEEKITGIPPANPEGGSRGNNTYEALVANADKMTAEEVAAQFMAIQNNK
ncbi:MULTISPECIES: phage scaffolding protein [Clostridium]|uniref:phage scaffolding protein n=1 Tax=Clostridium TaxID=1485 RepID=UPI00232B4710|nr:MULTISPECIES: phage scaffolding protein [Clostridium]MBS5927018.1 phage scaffolding protein [Clostridium sp.]MDB2101749.1 phage scaffolding protein [Clostridium paraputrificum]MDU2108638.1 phage scaffolding protein [Clostridium sp.]MDU3354852.1 phage scaffolding protein [Clostridium sp.]